MKARLSQLTPSELDALAKKFTSAEKERLAALIREKRAAGLPEPEAREVAARQILRDSGHPDTSVN